MDLPLRPDDFPLTAIGALVYRRTLSSPMFVAPGPSIAQDLVERLNRVQPCCGGAGMPCETCNADLSTTGFEGGAIIASVFPIPDGQRVH